MNQAAFQDLIPQNHCWGCGPANERGLRLKSHWDGDEAVAEWTPLPEHAAGPVHLLNGGIIATLLDCHSISTAIADAYRREGREIGQGDLIWYVTARIEVRYARPTPIDSPLRLLARVTEIERRKSWVDGRLSSGGELRASSKLLAVRVTSDWTGHAGPAGPR